MKTMSDFRMLHNKRQPLLVVNHQQLLHLMLKELLLNPVERRLRMSNRLLQLLHGSHLKKKLRTNRRKLIDNPVRNKLECWRNRDLNWWFSQLWFPLHLERSQAKVWWLAMVTEKISHRFIKPLVRQEEDYWQIMYLVSLSVSIFLSITQLFQTEL